MRLTWNFEISYRKMVLPCRWLRTRELSLSLAQNPDNALSHEIEGFLDAGKRVRLVREKTLSSW